MPDIIRKVFNSEIKSFNDKELIIEHFISTEQEDRSKDIVRADGMMLDGMPAVLKQHGFDPIQGNEPIAKPLDIRVAVNNKGVKGILVKTKYYDGSKLTPPDNTGQRLYEKARDGHMDKFSIGFRGVDMVPRPEGGVEYKKWQLFEYSQVGVPDNVGATVVKGKDATELLTFGVGDSDLDVAIDAQNEIIRLTNKQVDSFIKKHTIEITEDDTVNIPEDAKPYLEKWMKQQARVKSIQERIKLEAPWEAMRLIWFAFLGELSSQEHDGSKKAVNGIIQEMIELVTPQAIAFSIACHDKPDDEKDHKSQIEKGYYTEPEADQTPSEPPVQQPVVSQSDMIKKAILGLKKPEPPKPKTLPFTIGDINKAVKEAVSSELTTAINKLKGKVNV